MSKMTEFGAVASVPAGYIMETVDPTGLINYQVTITNLSTSLHTAVGTEVGAEVNDSVSVGGGAAVPTGSKQGSSIELRSVIGGTGINVIQNASTIEIESTSSGSGDVTGPSGGVADNEIAVYSGTTGKIIKGSGGALLGDYAKVSEAITEDTDDTHPNPVRYAILTQAAYDALTPDGDVLYFISG